MKIVNILAFVLVSGAFVSNAEETKWLSAADGTWTDSTKWDNGVPLAGTNAVLAAEGNAYTVTLNEAPSAGDVSLSGNAILHLGAGGTLAIDNGVRAVTLCDSAKITVDTASSADQRVLGSGTHVFSGYSQLDLTSCSKRIDIGSTLTGYENLFDLTFRDHACIKSQSAAYPTYVRIFNPKKETYAHLTFDSDATSTLGAGTFVGLSNGGNSWKGNARVDIKRGYLTSGGNFGLAVGYNANTYYNTFLTTGIVAIAGGALVSKANHGDGRDSTAQYNAFRGTLIGRAPAMEGSRIAYGSLEVSGGAFTNMNAYFVVGTGRAYGRVLQTGGVISSIAAYDPSRPIVLGFAGGEGEYILSNGVFTAQNPIYVGGIAQETMRCQNFTPENDTSGEIHDYTHPGTGRLVVSSSDSSKPCSLTLDTFRTTVGELVVGTNGTGEVEIGEHSILICRGATLNGPNATLKFDLGKSGDFEAANANADSFLRVKGTLNVGAGAKLIVDARRFDNSKKWIRLIRTQYSGAGGRTGSFAEGDITILGGGCVVQDRPGYTDGSVWYKRSRGLMLILR